MAKRSVGPKLVLDLFSDSKDCIMTTYAKKQKLTTNAAVRQALIDGCEVTTTVCNTFQVEDDIVYKNGEIQAAYPFSCDHWMWQSDDPARAKQLEAHPWMITALPSQQSQDLPSYAQKWLDIQKEFERCTKSLSDGMRNALEKANIEMGKDTAQKNTFSAALAGMKAGEKWRHSKMRKGNYACINDDGFIVCSKGKMFDTHTDDTNATDWQRYEPADDVEVITPITYYDKNGDYHSEEDEKTIEYIPKSAYDAMCQERDELAAAIDECLAIAWESLPEFGGPTPAQPARNGFVSSTSSILSVFKKALDELAAKGGV